MALPSNIGKWRSGLRRGATGRAVQRLQRRLAAFGYDSGEPDGRFGYVTEDALIQFQKEYRLKVDGVAGREVWGILHGSAPADRIVHIVQPGERVADIASAYRVSEEWIRWTNRIKGRVGIYPGKRIVLRFSCILVTLRQRLDPLDFRTLATRAHRFSGVVDPIFTYSSGGEVAGDWDPQRVAAVKETGSRYIVGVFPDAEDEGSGAMRSFRFRKRDVDRFVGDMVSIVRDVTADGLFVDMSSVPTGYGKWLLRAVIQLRKALPETFLALCVRLVKSKFGLFMSDLDYAKLATYVDRIVLGTHRWTTLLQHGRDQVCYERIGYTLSRMQKSVSPRRLLLGMPLGAVSWKDDHEARAIPYHAALADAYARGRRPEVGVDGFTRFDMDIDKTDGDNGTMYTIQSPHSFARLLSVAHAYRLGGVMLHPLGYEDRRQWDVLARRMSAGRLL